MHAYFTTALKAGGSADFPSSGASGLQEIEEKRYVVLRNVNSVLAVYRVRNDGILKRLRRWPAEFEEGLLIRGEVADGQ
ncbi:MAG: hypothetical protein C5B58_07465 [Acidobacteria bacterium]|nr:MAG: hypothetical protein C5B58_07465 [Acidobacteriota bacterium]